MNEGARIANESMWRGRVVDALESILKELRAIRAALQGREEKI